MRVYMTAVDMERCIERGRDTAASMMHMPHARITAYISQSNVCERLHLYDMMHCNIYISNTSIDTYQALHVHDMCTV